MTDRSRSNVAALGRSLAAAFIAALTTCGALIVVMDRLYVPASLGYEREARIARLERIEEEASVLRTELKADIKELRTEMKELTTSLQQMLLKLNGGK